jgi:hypothetical protein
MAIQQQQLKQKYVGYFLDVPVQRYAAMYIGRDEDTVIRWRKEDTQFAEAVQRAKAEWIRKKVIATKAEFALERLERDIFSSKSSVEIGITQKEPREANTQLAAEFTAWLKLKTKS